MAPASTNKKPMSKKCANRVLIWKMAYYQANTNLKAAKHIWESQIKGRNALQFFEFEHCGMRHSESSALVAWRALSEHALILARHLFTTGHAGSGFADNKKDSEVDQVRKEIEAEAVSKLGWSASEYARFCESLFSRTNELLAHYDGTRAEYDESVEGITKMRMIGANLTMSELEKLEAFIAAMEASIHDRLV